MNLTTLVMMKVMMGVANWISPIHFGGEYQNCREKRNESIIRIHFTQIPGTATFLNRWGDATVVAG